MKTRRNLFKLIALISVILFVGCSNDDEAEKQASLIGKYYSGFAYSAVDILGNTYDVYRSYRFIDENNAEKTANKHNSYGSIIGDPDKYTYEYKYPEIIFKDADGKESKGNCISEDVFRISDINYKKQ